MPAGKFAKRTEEKKMGMQNSDGCVAVLRDPSAGLVTVRTVLRKEAIVLGTLRRCFSLYNLGEKHGFGVSKPCDITIEALQGDMIISAHFSARTSVEFQNQVYRRFISFLSEAGFMHHPICCKIKVPFGAAPLH